MQDVEASSITSSVNDITYLTKYIEFSSRDRMSQMLRNYSSSKKETFLCTISG